jgi:uncharacterized membrane protein
MMESAQVESSVPETPRAEPERKAEGITRLVSLDAFRGIVMILMLAEQMRLPEVARRVSAQCVMALNRFQYRARGVARVLTA